MFPDAFRDQLAALSPSVVQARLRFLANFLSEGRVIGIAFGSAAIVSGRVVSIECCVLAESLRQIRVSQKLAPKTDQIRLALREHPPPTCLLAPPPHDNDSPRL